MVRSRETHQGKLGSLLGKCADELNSRPWWITVPNMCSECSIVPPARTEKAEQADILLQTVPCIVHCREYLYQYTIDEIVMQNKFHFLLHVLRRQLAEEFSFLIRFSKMSVIISIVVGNTYGRTQWFEIKLKTFNRAFKYL